MNFTPGPRQLLRRMANVYVGSSSGFGFCAQPQAGKNTFAPSDFSTFSDVNVLVNELAEIVGVPLDELELALLVALLVALPLAAADDELLDLLELPHAATAQQAQIAATTRKSLLFSKLLPPGFSPKATSSPAKPT